MSQENLQQPADNNRLRTDTLAASVVILMLVTVVQRSVGFGRGILFCRWLTPESLGQWEMAYSFLMLAAPLAVLGVPGSFGRYVEHYRQRGHLRTFLRRTTLWTGVCCLLATGLLIGFARQFSQLIFGSEDWTSMITGIAFCLAAIIFHHMLASLFTALRMVRVVSAMNFANSLLFAILSLGLLWWQPQVSSLLIGYGVACLLASLGAIAWTLPGFKQIEQPQESLAQYEFWGKLLRFAFFVWISNFLAHLFGIVDRYMIVHYGGLTPAEAMVQVGFYHSSRLVPLLMVSFADLLSSLSLPHLSADWESGHREQVGRRLNFTLKITCLGMLVFGVCVLWFSPLLFQTILQGKYDRGMAVLPWTLAGCSWYGIYAVAHNYLWCAEKTRQATLPLAVGLVVNIGLNLLLLPIWGLLGAVLATAISSFLCVLLTLLLSRHYGMPVGRGTWLLGLIPIALGLGTFPATVTLLLLMPVAIATPLIFDLHERNEIRQQAAHYLAKLWPPMGRRTMPTPPTTTNRPLRVMFLITSMPVGGAETLLMNLVRGMDRARFQPEICCLKKPGPLGKTLQAEMPVHSGLIQGKYDIRVLPRLWKLLQRRQIDAVITVGAGDKMFWGRLAARLARVPVVVSALHSTGWPDGVGRLNRLLTPWTDAFIAVADTHARFLVEWENFPDAKVQTIHNGIDTCRFAPEDPKPIRSALGISFSAPVVGIVAALRTEKNHELFLRGAQQIAHEMPGTQFLIIGDGPRQEILQHLARDLDLTSPVHFLGSREDIPQLISACDVLALTSHNEANPVSILEAFGCGCPVVAADVGSIRETVVPGETGCLFPAGDTEAYVESIVSLLKDPALCHRFGNEGRRRVQRDWSLQRMVDGYQTLIANLYDAKEHRGTRSNAVYRLQPERGRGSGFRGSTAR